MENLYHSEKFRQISFLVNSLLNCYFHEIFVKKFGNSPSHLFGKNFVKAMGLLKKVLQGVQDQNLPKEIGITKKLCTSDP